MPRLGHVGIQGISSHCRWDGSTVDVSLVCDVPSFLFNRLVMFEGGVAVSWDDRRLRLLRDISNNEWTAVGAYARI